MRADGTEKTPEPEKPARSSGRENVQNDAIALLSGMKENPFSVGTYHSKRATHKVNELGDIIGEDEAPENIHSIVVTAATSQLPMSSLNE